MKLTLPEGYEIPDDVEVGEPFEAVATIISNEDGSFRLSAIDGIELDAEEEDSEEDEDEEAVVEEDMSGIRLPWTEE